MSSQYVSIRAADNLVRTKLGEVRSYCFHNAYDRDTNPDGIIALAIAENKLMRDEITAHLNTNFGITPWHLTYGDGSTGSNALKHAVTKIMNREFRPLQEIKSEHVCICNGAGSAVNNLCFCVGEPGDGVLIGRPLYTGFFPDIEAFAKVKPVLVSFGKVDPLSPEAVECYEQALIEFNSTKPGRKIRGLLLSSPHNPLGRPYAKESLVEYLKLCAKYDIHFFSDEVYCKSNFPSHDYPTPPPFVSVLSLPISEYCDPALVHIIYGMSKDFCANGIRIGCIVSPFNKEVLGAFKAVSSFTRASQLAEHVWLNLLNDEKYLKWYFPELQRRMTEAYEHLTALLRKRNVPYSKASVSSFLWVDVSRYIRDDIDPEDAELELNWRMAKKGVWVGMGASFASEAKGWVRITFASPRDEVEMGMERFFQVLEEVKNERSDIASGDAVTETSNR